MALLDRDDRTQPPASRTLAPHGYCRSCGGERPSRGRFCGGDRCDGLGRIAHADPSRPTPVRTSPTDDDAPVLDDVRRRLVRDTAAVLVIGGFLALMLATVPRAVHPTGGVLSATYAPSPRVTAPVSSSPP